MVALMLTYAIFIPNTWRRAARLIVPMALAPMAVPWILGLLHPERYASGAPGRRSREDQRGRAVPAAGRVHGDLRHAHDQHPADRGLPARLLNQYRLGRKLGGGGMGEVYLAEHQLLKRPCAIKLIRLGPGRRTTRISARFEREVRGDSAALALEHDRDLRLRPQRQRRVLLRRWSICPA